MLQCPRFKKEGARHESEQPNPEDSSLRRHRGVRLDRGGGAVAALHARLPDATAGLPHGRRLRLARRDRPLARARFRRGRAGGPRQALQALREGPLHAHLEGGEGVSEGRLHTDAARDGRGSGGGGRLGLLLRRADAAPALGGRPLHGRVHQGLAGCALPRHGRGFLWLALELRGAEAPVRVLWRDQDEHLRLRPEGRPLPRLQQSLARPLPRGRGQTDRRAGQGGPRQQGELRLGRAPSPSSSTTSAARAPAPRSRWSCSTT